MQIYHGDALRVLRGFAPESVQCCVTSPPYWGLRDYGTAKWNGGEPGCDHKPRRNHPAADKQASQAGSSRDKIGRDCGKCGAVRIDAQLGLEATPEEYVARMVEVFREVRRVLRDDGTLWLNLGDSYARQQENNVPQSKNRECVPPAGTGRIKNAGLKPKDLVGIPWRVAFALQADGWYLRSDIIWHKPNPMPESVTDRPTKAHEYLFLLAKSERYYYDADAIKEACQADTTRRYERGRSGKHKYDDGGPGHQTIARTFEPMRLRHSGNVARKLADGRNGSRLNTHLGSSIPWEDTGEGRNRRTVWTVATRPFKGAHFATFPPKLIEPCILAGCPVGGVVLDPFAGAGTTGLVSAQLGREFVGIELNKTYCVMATKRMAAA